LFAIWFHFFVYNVLIKQCLEYVCFIWDYPHIGKGMEELEGNWIVYLYMYAEQVITFYRCAALVTISYF